MQNVHKVTEDILAIGASDHRLSRFENIFPLSNGVSYNNYLILDEQTALMDTSDVSVSDQFLENLHAALGGRPLDYLVIHHMEPDHASTIGSVLRLYPDVSVVCGRQAFTMLCQFYPEHASVRHIEMAEGGTLCTGRHTLHFIAAPMVHWPEVMVSYDELDKVLFSADAFGSFGAVEGSIFADEHDFQAEYLDEARRYYANIVGKFGMQVQALLRKAAGLDIRIICPLHGPVQRGDLSGLLSLYQKWSSYTPETEDILLVYCSLYGHTESAAQAAAMQIRSKSGRRVHVYDASETDCSYLIAEVWRCAKIVLFCPTYNMGIYPKMLTFLHDMKALLVQNRIFALAENGTWSPVAAKLMRAELEGMKNITILDETLTIRSALHEADADRLDAFTTAVAEA